MTSCKTDFYGTKVVNRSMSCFLAYVEIGLYMNEVRDFPLCFTVHSLYIVFFFPGSMKMVIMLFTSACIFCENSVCPMITEECWRLVHQRKTVMVTLRTKMSSPWKWICPQTKTETGPVSGATVSVGHHSEYSKLFLTKNSYPSSYFSY